MSSMTYINSNGIERKSINALIKRHANASALAVQSGLPKNLIEIVLIQVPNFARAQKHVFAMRSPTSPRSRSPTSPRRRSHTSHRRRSPTHETLANRINRVIGSKPKLPHTNYAMNSNNIRTTLKHKINSRAFSDRLEAMNNRELIKAADAMRGDNKPNKMKALAKLSGQPFTNMLERHLYRNGGLLNNPYIYRNGGLLNNP